MILFYQSQGRHIYSFYCMLEAKKGQSREQAKKETTYSYVDYKKR